MTELSALDFAVDAESAPYWQGLREGRVLIQRCRACGEAQLYFRAICQRCWSDQLTQETVSGMGNIYSFAVVHVNGDPMFTAQTPYVLALVELDEGPRVATRIESPAAAVSVGRRVQPIFRRISDERTLLYYECAGGERDAG